MDRLVIQGSVKKPLLQQQPQKDEKPVVKTRFGYEARDCVRSLQEVLAQSGPSATAKALHLSADLICSGGFEIWIRLLWSFVFQHVHLSSLRIFIYLQERTKNLESHVKELDIEQVYRNIEFQQLAAESVMVVQTLPRQSKIIWPKVPEETHDPSWISTVSGVKESEAVRKVWDPQHDQPIMKFVGNQILNACEEVNIEKALFWLKWILEEDKRLRASTNGYSMTTSRRSGNGSTKLNKLEIGYFLIGILAEAYKDLAKRQLVRMHEEFQCLLDLWRGKQDRLSSRQKQECLALMILVISEVPRWKVPAAQPLIKDPVLMSRAVQQSVKFFTEILVNPRVPTIMPRDITGAQKKKGPSVKGTTKATGMEDQMRLMDEMVMAFIQR
jgi:hypothetical protein